MLSLSHDLKLTQSIPLAVDEAEGEYVERNAFVRSVLINGRLYIFSNLSPEGANRKDGSCVVKIIDFDMKRIFGVELWQARPENKPSSVRVNYSIAHFKHKVYLYGGIDQ